MFKDMRTDERWPASCKVSVYGLKMRMTGMKLRKKRLLRARLIFVSFSSSSSVYLYDVVQEKREKRKIVRLSK